MKDISKEKVDRKFETQKEFFNKNKTRDVEFRIKNLKKLKTLIKENEDRITGALHEDLRKSPEEAYLTEISVVVQEIDHHIKSLKKWAKPEKVTTPWHLKPSRSKLYYEPLGVVLIISPWNYPFQLLLNPLVGAISAGCCAVLKPSPDAPATALLVQELIDANFSSAYITVAQGGKEANTSLLAKPFDSIFFTGSSRVGKIVMEAAAKNLTPVILELGGKSPCIVDKDANLDVAAKRIAWGKTINAGQTCIAPDYLLVQESIKEELIEKIGKNFKDLYGGDIRQNSYYPRIVHNDALERLEGLLQYGNVRTGGEVDKEDKYFEPTIMDNVELDSPLMQEEIFGPILPVLTFKEMEEALEFVRERKKPLAFYFFGKNYDDKKILEKTSSGGACINDTLLHIANHSMPFGGVGNSGIGKYHGKHSFFAFSNSKAVVSTPTWIDIPFRYPPFKHMGFLKRFI